MRKLIIIMMAFLLIIWPVNKYLASEETDDLKAEIKAKSKLISDKESQLEILKDKIADLEEKEKTLIIQKEEVRDSIKELEPKVRNYLSVIQKYQNNNMYLVILNNENFLDSMNAMNIISSAILGQINDLKGSLIELKIKEQQYEQTKEKIKNDQQRLNEDLENLKVIYTELNEELLELEKTEVVEITNDSGANVSSEKKELMRQAGISESQYSAADFIITKESGWNYTAQNPYSDAYGLCQALPGSKMSSAGADWATNPVTQLKWCDSYANSAYGSWSGAQSFWLSHNWW